MKNMFSLVSTYISWSSLNLPTPRMRKTNESCMVSAAHPLVKRGSYRLFRFSSFRYVMHGVIFISRPPLRGDRRYLLGGVFIPEVKFGVSSSKIAVFRNVIRVRHANYSVAGCKNQHQRLYSVTATEQQKKQWLCFIFNDNVPLQFQLACMCVLTTSHRTASVTRVSPPPPDDNKHADRNNG